LPTADPEFNYRADLAGSWFITDSVLHSGTGTNRYLPSESINSKQRSFGGAVFFLRKGSSELSGNPRCFFLWISFLSLEKAHPIYSIT
jgi:hypothetical protein